MEKKKNKKKMSNKLKKIVKFLNQKKILQQELIKKVKILDLQYQMIESLEQISIFLKNII